MIFTSNNQVEFVSSHFRGDQVLSNEIMTTGEWSNQTSLQQTTANVRIVLSCFLSLLNIVAIVGNLTVIAAILIDKTLYSTANLLLASLAISDLIVTAIVMPRYVYEDVSNTGWAHGNYLCNLWLTASHIGINSSILGSAAIAYLRYIAVTKPFVFSNMNATNRRDNTKGVLLVGIWLFSSILSTPILFANGEIRGNHCKIDSPGLLLYLAVFAFFIPTWFVLYLYTSMLSTLKMMAKRRFNRRRFVSRTVPNDGDVSRIMLFNSMAATGFITGSARKALYAVNGKMAHPRLSSIHSIPMSLQLQLSSTSKAAKPSESDEISEQINEPKKKEETKTTASIYDEKSGVYIGEMREDELKRHSFQSIAKGEQTTRPRLGKVGKFKTTDDSYSLRFEQSFENSGLFMKSMEAPSLMWIQGGSPSSLSSPMAFAGNDYFNCESTITTPQRKSRATLISISDIFKKSFKYSQAKIKDRKSSIIIVTILMFYFVCRCPLYTSYVVSWMASLSGNLVAKVPDRFDRVFTWLALCNSAVNPFLYTGFNAELRRTLCGIISRFDFRKRSIS